MISPSEDAFGTALLDYLEGEQVPDLGAGAGRVSLHLCGNLGLGGSWEGNRRLLTRLADLAAPGAVLVGDSVTPDGPPQVALRIRYGGLVTPWWPQYNIPAGQMAALVEGTGWRMERHLEDGADHAVLLRRG